MAEELLQPHGDRAADRRMTIQAMSQWNPKAAVKALKEYLDGPALAKAPMTQKQIHRTMSQWAAWCEAKEKHGHNR